MRNRWLVCVAALGSIGATCNDPPKSGYLSISIDVSRLRPDVSQVAFTVDQLDVYYDITPVAPAEKDVTCESGQQSVVTIQPKSITLDLTKTGRTFVGNMQVPAGRITEIRLVLSALTVVENGIVRPFHPSLNCQDYSLDGDEAGVVRLLPRDASGFVVGLDQTVAVIAQFNPATDITHVHGDDPAPTADGGQTNKNDKKDAGASKKEAIDAASIDADTDQNGDLHGGRWILAPALPITVIPPIPDGLVPGQICLGFKAGTDQGTIDSDITSESGHVVLSWQPSLFYVVQLPLTADEFAVIKDLQSKDEVDFALPNFYTDVYGLPNDWNLANDEGDQPDWLLADVPRAWDAVGGTGSPRFLVAVVDTGIDLQDTHYIANLWINEGEIPPAIKNLQKPGGGTYNFDVDGDGVITFDDLTRLGDTRVCSMSHAKGPDGKPMCSPLDLVDGMGDIYGWQDGVDNDGDPLHLVDDIVGWNFVANNNVPGLDINTEGADRYLHGTVVARVIGDVGNDDYGFVGIPWRVRMMPLHANDAGSIIAALNYAAYRNADVINLSRGQWQITDNYDKSGLNPQQCGCRMDDTGQCVMPMQVDVGSAHQDSASNVSSKRDQLKSEWGHVQLGRTLLVNAVTDCNIDLTSSDAYDWPTIVNTQGLRVAAVLHRDLSYYGATGPGIVDVAAPNGSTSFAAPIVSGAAALLHSVVYSGPNGVAAEASLTSCQVADRIVRNAARTLTVPPDKVLPLPAPGNCRGTCPPALDVGAAAFDDNSVATVRNCP